MNQLIQVLQDLFVLLLYFLDFQSTVIHEYWDIDVSKLEKFSFFVLLMLESSHEEIVRDLILLLAIIFVFDPHEDTFHLTCHVRLIQS